MPQRSYVKSPSSKYRAKRCEIDGIKFHSLLEGRYYQSLILRQRSGEKFYFHMQVPIQLPGGVKYLVDFMIIYPDGKVEYIDVKGVKTSVYIIKKKQVEALYPIKIIEIDSFGRVS